MKIQTYNDIEIDVLSQSDASSRIMKLACDVTQKRKIDLSKSVSEALITYLNKAGHTSIFEHGSMTFLAKGISRSLLAQVTRQRHFSFTSASQHFQDYRNYPMSLRFDWDDFDFESESEDATLRKNLYEDALNRALKSYQQLISLGELPEEARQVLPNACTVNLVITANPRALCEFLNTRLCKRNTEEMLTFARKLQIVCLNWIPEIFKYTGPDCIRIDQCNQGKMACKK